MSDPEEAVERSAPESLRDALAALRDNIKQQQMAEFTRDNAGMDLSRVYWGMDPPEAGSAHHEVWTRQHAVMDEAKRVIDMAVGARPGLVRRLAQLAGDSARRFKGPDGLRASAARLAVDLQRCLPSCDPNTLQNLLAEHTTDLEALGLLADAPIGSDDAAPASSATGGEPIPECVKQAVAAAARLSAAAESPFPDLSLAMSNEEIEATARAVLKWSDRVMSAFGIPGMAKKFPGAVTTLFSFPLSATPELDSAQAFLGDLPPEFLEPYANFRPRVVGPPRAPVFAGWPNPTPIPADAERWPTLRDALRARHAAAMTQCRRLVGWIRTAATSLARTATHGKDGVLDPDQLVTVEEAASFLDRPARTIRNWIGRKRDKLEPVDRLGGPRKFAERYRLGDILARQPMRPSRAS